MKTQIQITGFNSTNCIVNSLVIDDKSLIPASFNSTNCIVNTINNQFPFHLIYVLIAQIVL